MTPQPTEITRKNTLPEAGALCRLAGDRAGAPHPRATHFGVRGGDGLPRPHRSRERRGQRHRVAAGARGYLGRGRAAPMHRLAEGVAPGPLFGLPIAIKDLALTKGLRTTFGSRIFADFVPDEDSYFVERLRKAGAIIIGKTNVPEFGFGSQTYNEVFGATRNAFDQRLTSGGSSGGAAVAVALNMLPLADGSDMCGSLRNPAGWNNVFGFRTSPGRVPTGPANELFLSQMGVEGSDGAQCRRPWPAARRAGRLRSARAAVARRWFRVVGGRPSARPELARRVARRSRRAPAGRGRRARSVRGGARHAPKPATSRSSRRFRISTSRRCGRPSSRCAMRPAARRSKSTTTTRSSAIC